MRLDCHSAKLAIRSEKETEPLHAPTPVSNRNNDAFDQTPNAGLPDYTPESISSISVSQTKRSQDHRIT